MCIKYFKQSSILKKKISAIFTTTVSTLLNNDHVPIDTFSGTSYKDCSSCFDRKDG